MKKLLLVLGVCLVLNIFAPIIPDANAAGGGFGAGLWDMVTGTGVVPDGEFLLPCPEEFNEIGQYASARTYIIKVLNFALSFLGLVAMGFVIYAGFLYVTAGGDDGQNEKAKKIVIYASVGILVVLISFALVNTLIRSAPSGSDDRVTTGAGGEVYSGDGTVVPDYCRQLGDGDVPEVTPVDISVSPGKSFGGGYMVDLSAGSLSFSTGMDGEWNFGDGMMGSGASTTHSYGERGAYEVYFLGEDAEGNFYGAKTVIVVDGVMADFRANKYEVIANEEITLDASASRSAVGSITNYAWTCAGCTGLQTTASFPSAGTYDITLTATNNIGAKGTATKTFTVAADKPTAVIDSIEPTGREHHPAEYQFDGTGSANVLGTPAGLRYVWDFGDGTGEKTTSNQTIIHEYVDPGNKTVSLKVLYTYQGQALESDPVTFNVSDVTTLWGDFQVPNFLLVDQEFSFQAESPEGATFLWDFPAEATVLDPNTFPTVRASFTEVGIHTVKLTVSKTGEPAPVIVQYPVYVRAEGEPMAIIQSSDDGGDPWFNVPWTLSTTRDNNGATDLHLRSHSIDPTGQEGCNVAQLNYSWSVDDTPVSAECAPDLNSYFTEVGSHSVKLTVYDPVNQNVQDTASFSVVVENLDPEFTQEITYQTNSNPTPIPEGILNFPVTVMAEDTDTNEPITSYKFEAVENGTVKDVQLLPTGTASFDLTQYDGIHTFSFRVTATDSDDGTAISTGTETYTFQNNIVNEPPVITDFTADKTGVMVGEEVRFDVTATDPEGEPLSYQWIVSSGLISATHDTGTDSFFIHTFTEAGTYTVQAEVSDGVNTVLSVDSITINVTQ